MRDEVVAAIGGGPVPNDDLGDALTMFELNITDYRAYLATPQAVLAYGRSIRRVAGEMRKAAADSAAAAARRR